MPDPLPPIVVTRMSGVEPLHFDGQPLAINLLSFWQWSTSDLVSNVTRGRLAEFIVATGLGADVSGVRGDWDAFDLITPEGVKVEVKSAARVQSWFQAKLSDVVFSTPRTRAWDPSTGRSDQESRRQADVYVLALLDHRNKSTIDPLNLRQWTFFVVPTRVLDGRKRSQHSIGLSSLQALSPPVQYSELKPSVAKAANAHGGAAA
ncbi:MAG: hypothetical protein OEM00_03140 [Burkholderiaceae bacterium]|nr:hypothetical protein [Burkholderiaceae bacterium]